MRTVKRNVDVIQYRADGVKSYYCFVFQCQKKDDFEKIGLSFDESTNFVYINVFERNLRMARRVFDILYSGEYLPIACYQEVELEICKEM